MILQKQNLVIMIRAIIHPLVNIEENTREYKIIKIRPLPESGLQNFPESIIQKEWDEVKATNDPSEQDILNQ